MPEDQRISSQPPCTQSADTNASNLFVNTELLTVRFNRPNISNWNTFLKKALQHKFNLHKASKTCTDLLWKIFCAEDDRKKD